MILRVKRKGFASDVARSDNDSKKAGGRCRRGGLGAKALKPSSNPPTKLLRDVEEFEEKVDGCVATSPKRNLSIYSLQFTPKTEGI